MSLLETPGGANQFSNKALNNLAPNVFDNRSKDTHNTTYNYDKISTKIRNNSTKGYRLLVNSLIYPDGSL